MLDDTSKKPLVSVRDLKMHFPIFAGLFRREVGAVKAVDGVSFDVFEGETLGLVGESGCGKSTLARAVLQLIPPTAGTVTWLGSEINGLSKRDLIKHRENLQIVFQDPLASLDPRMTISASIMEPLRTFRPGMTSRERKIAVAEMMEKVGLEQSMINRYPPESSCG